MTWLDKEKLLAWIESEMKISANGYQVGYQTALKFMEYQLLMGKFDAPEANTELWTCPLCGFAMDASHSEVDGSGYKCPACAEIKLESEANQLREERDAYKKHAEDFETLYLQEHRAKNSSNRENAKLVKALEWYGNKENYQLQNQDEYDKGEFAIYHVMGDEGERARTTLSELRGENTNE